MNTLLDATGAQVLTPTWTNQSEFGPLTSPMVAAGDKLLCVAGRVIYAIDIHTGQQVKLPGDASATWGIELENHSGNEPHLTATNGVVYLMDGSDLRAVRLADAAPLDGWKTPRRLGRAVSLIARHGLLMAIYQARKGSSVRAFHAASGAVAYREVKISDATPGPVAYGADAVFFVAGGKLHGVNIRSGDKRWTYAANEKLSELHAPCVAGQLVLTSGQHLHGIDLNEGSASFKIAPGTASPAVWHTPAYHIPSTLHAATQTVNLRARRPATAGTPLLKAELDPMLRIAAGVAVASNSQGDLICLSLADGKVLWRKQLDAPGAPRIIDDVVYVKTTGGTRLERFRLDNGVSAGLPYSLQGLPNNQPVSITNGMLLLPDELGNVSARPYAKQLAAYFDGKQSRIDIAADGQHFDLGERNFTVEAWFRSSSGGEILSAYPTKPDANSAGFRLNLTPDGQIRVALFSADAQRLRAGRTSRSNACDGHWHHVALVRRNDNFVIVLDGVPQEVHLPDEEGAKRLSIGSSTALTIGAFVPSSKIAPSQHFAGLIREVRLWNCAMEAPLIESNRQVALIGNEPQLLGLWRLDALYSAQDPAAVSPRNDASGHRGSVKFNAPAARPTDLEMNRSAFPYLLREAKKQWPYANTWGARGVDEVDGPAAVSDNGVVAFVAGPVLYAVNAHDGRRKWSMDVSKRISAPVADSDSFLLLTEDDAVVRIDARSGAKYQLPAFGALQAQVGGVLPSPATSQSHIAAAAGTQLLIAQRQAETPVSVTLPTAALSLAFGQGGLLALTGAGKGWNLALYDLEKGQQIGHRQISSSVYCAGGAWVYAVDDGAVIKLGATDLAGAPLARQPIGTHAVSGLAAAFDQGVVVVTDGNGSVTGLDAVTLTQLWTTPLPGSAGKRVNQPVFDHGGRIICTSASGAVTVLAARSGQLLGYYQMQNAAVHTPAISAGTVYTGCLNSDNEQAALDGAMHSLVLGETVALRLNLDALGQPVPDGKQYAVIDKASDHTTLQLLRPGQSTVETWINVPRLNGDQAGHAGGGILGIAPSDESGFGINLWLDAAGILHYEAQALEDGSWSAVHQQAQVEVMDGRWHHIAVSKRAGASPEQVVLYVDGKIVSTDSGATPPIPQRVASGLCAYIGASVAEDRTPARHFHGMIAEVRVWDTYLVAPAILQRMQVKLRGDEPDLVAYWNFDYQAVHDAAQQGHSGELALAPSSNAPAWWLTDLPFTQPNYPYIATSATVDTSDQGSTYALQAKVCAADGKGLASQQVELWYIKQRPSDPDTINVNGTQLMAVKQGSEPDPVLKSMQAERVLRATTGADGTLTLNIATSQAGHGPALDLWTAFMPVNQRFHVNVLLDNQRLSKPAPPVLTAQAKLIQDYNYTRGDKINHERDRSTWRVVLRSREASGTLRMKEPVTLWSSTATTIEVAGVRYQINSERSVTLDSQANGELVVVMEAEQLVSPTLYARAGFMHRNERIIINADQDAQKQLEAMSAEDMTRERQTNWQKDPAANAKGDSLLSKDQQPHAGEISKAVRQVASSASNEEPKQLLKSAPSPARLKLAELRRAQRPAGLLKAGADDIDDLQIDAMRQEEAGARIDGVALMRSMAGVSREALVNQDAFRASLGGTLGFELSAKPDGSGVQYRALHNCGEVALLHASAGRPPLLQAGAPKLLGGLLDLIVKAWDTVTDVVTNIYEGAKSIAITIGETIQVAVTKMVNGIKSVVNAVVATVEDALRAIAGFFEQLVVAIKKVIAFLRALFDWGAILKAQRFFIKLMNTGFKETARNLRDKEQLRKIIGDIGRLGDVSVPTGKDSLNGSANKAGGRDSAVISGSDGVQANSMLQKSRENPMTSKGESTSTPGEISKPIGQKLKGMEHLLPGLANSILDLSPADLIQQLMAAVKQALSDVLEEVANGFAEACSKLADVLDVIRSLLQTEIYIPFISEIYEWVTGTKLSIMSLLALVLGVFFNALYAFVTLIVDGDARSFGDDASSISLTPNLAGALTDRGPPPTTPAIFELIYMGLRCLTIAADCVSDYIYYKMATAGRSIASPTDVIALAGASLFQTLLGVGSTLMFRLKCEPAFHNRLKHVLGSNRSISIRREEVIYTIMALQGALAIVKFAKVISTTLNHGKEASPATNWLTKEIEWISGCIAYDMHLILQTLCLASTGMIIFTLVDLYRPDTKQELDAMNCPDLKQEHILLSYEAVMMMVPLMFEVLYSPEGIRQVLKSAPPSVVYGTTGVLRLLASGASVALHGVATLKYGNPEW